LKSATHDKTTGLNYTLATTNDDCVARSVTAREPGLVKMGDTPDDATLLAAWFRGRDTAEKTCAELNSVLKVKKTKKGKKAKGKKASPPQAHPVPSAMDSAANDHATIPCQELDSVLPISQRMNEAMEFWRSRQSVGASVEQVVDTEEENCDWRPAAVELV